MPVAYLMLSEEQEEEEENEEEALVEETLVEDEEMMARSGAAAWTWARTRCWKKTRTATGLSSALTSSPTRPSTRRSPASETLWKGRTRAKDGV